MTARSIFSRWAAIFAAVLMGMAAAPVAAQSIENTARADWREHGSARNVESNTVTLDVDRSPLAIGTYRADRSGSTNLVLRPSQCGIGALSLTSTEAAKPISLAVSETPDLTAGETFYFQITSPLANRDPGKIDWLTATLVSSAGDREVLRFFETGADTGRFSGSIPTRPAPPAKIGDCRLSVSDGETIDVAISKSQDSSVLLTSSVKVLADPFGVVFDSEDGSPISGARITLIDDSTGSPADVFGEDGVTPWPSTVISGAAITDAGGSSYRMSPGAYWFPRVPLGRYHLDILPPAPYAAPSTASPAKLAKLVRPGGRSFTIADASYGRSFSLDDLQPVEVDVPLDRPNVAATVTKTVSRPRAQPGDSLFYTVQVRNQDSAHVKSGVTLSDIPSPWLKLRPASVRIDGVAAGDDVVEFSEDGRRMTILVPDLAAAQTVRITYAMTVRADAPAGEAVNRVEANDDRGGRSVAEAVVRIDRDAIASKMTVMGRITEGTCNASDVRVGIPGVRVMMEDGSFAITDHDGRYHFEGVAPGTHVVQAQRQTLPNGGNFVDCDRSSRSGGSASSRFVIGQGGTLAVADFTAEIPGWAPLDGGDVSGIAARGGRGELLSSAEAAGGGDRDWFDAGDGPPAFLFPGIDHNPRSPAVRVVIRHEPDQSVTLFADGTPVDVVTFEGTKSAPDRSFAISIWRGIPLGKKTTHFEARVVNADGSVAEQLKRDLAFVSGPWNAEFLPELSHLVADGKTRPVVAIRVTDREGRPVRDGISGSVSINEPYESAALLDRMQSSQLSAGGSTSPTWTIEGDVGIALIELAPTMISGPLHLEFEFTEDKIARHRELDSWIVPGDLEWTIIGLAEGSIGARTVADNMERSGDFDSDFGDEARMALYAKGSILGKYLLTISYDSAKQGDEQRLAGTIDPNAYYTVFADGSDRRFDAASREKLYLRVETSTFYALYGDFVTGFDQTVLARYQRTLTGAKAEGRFGAFHAQGFAAGVSSRQRRDEIQGAGISGPYRLSSRAMMANSERVAIEVRDRFRSELLIDRHELTRFIDYDIDLLSGTITFREPVLSRDFQLNPQFIVIDYEVEDGAGRASWNAGVRADYTFEGDRMRIGATALSDKGEGERTDIGAIDLRARIGESTELRGEMATSRSDGEASAAWLVEAEHRTGSLDLLAYAREVEPDFGLAQLNGAVKGRRKIGVDARYGIDEAGSLTVSAWQDDSLSDEATRRAVQLTAGYRTASTEGRIGISHFGDTSASGEESSSTVLEGAVSRRFLDNRLELGLATSIALDSADSIDLPTRHSLRARYALTDWLRLMGTYELADGNEIEARTFNGGVEVSPWTGSRLTTTLGRQDIGERGARSFAAFGLSQSIRVSDTLMVDATVDGNKTLAGADPYAVINPQHPVASGGHLSQSGALFEEFTATTLGASWRKDKWAATGRAEYRDGEYADSKGATFGVIRQLADGIVIGSGLDWTRAQGHGDAETEILDATISAAFRPASSSVALLGKLEYRSDRVAGAIRGEAGPVGRTALDVTGEAKSERLVASLSANWSPIQDDDGAQSRRTEFGVFLGGRYGLDSYDGFDLSGTTVLGGLDARIGIGKRLEIGGTATVRASLEDDVTSFSFGPQIGFVPADETLVTVGYNVSGFRDADFAAARSTDKGLYASVRLKFDADSFSFLGLGGR